MTGKLLQNFSSMLHKNKVYSFGIAMILFPACMFYSCKGPEPKAEDKEAKTESAGTPVTLTKVSKEPILEYVELNATSTFLMKSYVKSNINGYIETVTVKPGEFVTEAKPLFRLITKEAKSIDNKVNELNPGFKFSGVNNIKANGRGYITQLNHQAGDYVQDGEQLAVISDVNSFAFILNLPYELKRYIKVGQKVDLQLADGSKLAGFVASYMPTVDPASQTQNVVIKISGDKNIPENLIAKVKIIKTQKAGAISLPKQAVLSNDVQSEFWVMQMIDANTAAKVPVTKGIETKDRIEITSPTFDTTADIILTGNYGLPDTAKVVVNK